MGTNDTANWERRLKGETIPLTSDMEPDYGFYRVRTKDRTSWRAVAYWYDEAGKIRCFLQGRGELSEDQAREIWSWASRNPITHALYKAVVENGEPWPDLNNEVTRISNMAPEDNSFEAIQERIDDLTREAERLMKAGAATTQDAADQAADVAKTLSDYWKRADNLRVVEKQPHLDASRVVDDKWRPLLTAANIYKTLEQVVCAPWLKAQKIAKENAEAEARRTAAEAAEAARKLEAEARQKAAEAQKTGDNAAIAEANLAAKKVEEATQTAVAAAQTAHNIASATVTAGTRGRGVHLRSDPVYEIEDRAAMFAFLIGNAKACEDIDATMLKHAKAISKTGIGVPGLKVTKDAKAA